jgi:hypothetical protein
LKFIRQEYIQKASQWCILNVKHAKIMIYKTDYIKWFSEIYAPDEICYITNIFINNLQNEIITTSATEDSNNATTFINWEDSNYKYSTPRNLKPYAVAKVYKNIDDEEILYLINSKCFFGRKFTKECSDLFSNEAYIDCIISYPNNLYKD